MVTKLIFVGVMSISFALQSTNHCVEGDIKDDYDTPHEHIDLAKLSEIEETYGSNLLGEDLLVPADENPQQGVDYIDYCNRYFYQSTSFDRVSYFRNLTSFSPSNNEGSCGYVSLIQAMSYYDTFYNDDIIPETFDRFYSTASTESEAKLHSPGTLRSSYYGSEFSSYYAYCYATQLESFESYLTILHNIHSNNVYSRPNNESNFSPSIGCWDYGDLLEDLYGTSHVVTVSTYSGKTQDEYKNIIKDIIDSGNPAIVHIEKNNSQNLHSVVAYDYDSNGIYANFGWSSFDNHSLLLGGINGYENIYYVATLNFQSFGHTHSNNYIINSKSYCGCNLDDQVYTQNSSLLTNVPPTLYWMKNQENLNESFRISFRSTQSGDNILSFTTHYNQMTLGFEYWKYINSYCLNYIYIVLERISDVVNFNERVTIVNKPYNLLAVKTLVPTDYGFADSYPTSEATSNYYQRHYVSDGFSFRTRRYRAGYIHNEYLVMSCVKTNITEAFIEFAFEVPITKIEVDLAHWREYSHEWLDKNSGIAELQTWHEKEWWNVFDSDRWVTALDLLSDETNLPRDRTNPTTYTINFSNPVYGFRFYSKINEQRTSDDNRGRICIGDLKLYLGGLESHENND